MFDPARLPGTAGILYSRGGGRTFKIGQHDDRYSNDPTTNTGQNNTADNVPASNGWASWRLADIFDVADPLELPGRININGVPRDKGAALLAALQGFQFQPTTTTDPVIHGDSISGLAGTSLDTTGTSAGLSQLVTQITTRLNPTATPANGPSGPFFERGEFGELGTGTSMLFGTNSSTTNNSLVASVDMNKTGDHSREEMFRRLAQMICTRGDTFTVYAAGQSILQNPTTTALKVTGTQRMRVTFRLVPKAKSTTPGAYDYFHPAYTTTTKTDGTIDVLNSIDPANPTEAPTNGQIGVIARFAKPDRYDVQILQATTY